MSSKIRGISCCHDLNEPFFLVSISGHHHEQHKNTQEDHQGKQSNGCSYGSDRSIRGRWLLVHRWIHHLSLSLSLYYSLTLCEWDGHIYRRYSSIQEESIKIIIIIKTGASMCWVLAGWQCLAVNDEVSRDTWTVYFAPVTWVRHVIIAS